MKLVHFKEASTQNMITLNVDNILYFRPTPGMDGTTTIYFGGDILVVVNESREQVESRLGGAA